MNIEIIGNKLDMSEALSEYVKDRVNEGVLKFFERAIFTTVEFEKESHLFHCDIRIDEGTGKKLFINSSAENSDIFTCFDTALVKLQTQLRKHKEKIRNRRHKKHTELPLNEDYIRAKKFVISAGEENESDNPIIIAENDDNIENLSVNEAVMKMDLLQLPALMFKNSKNGNLNLVYYRKDGNISWVDPEIASHLGEKKHKA